MRFVRFFALSLVLVLCSFTLHKYYMSMAHVKYVPAQESIQITLRIFIDDLQLEINKTNQTNIELATDREPKKIDSIYESYLTQNFQVEINEKTLNHIYIGQEYKDDMAVFYLEILNVKNIEKLKIENNILYHSFPEQENIVKLNINDKNKSFILTKNQSTALINY